MLLLSQGPATKRDAVLLCREIQRLRESTPLILCTPGGRAIPALVMRAGLQRKCTVCGPDMVAFNPGTGRNGAGRLQRSPSLFSVLPSV